MDAGSISGHPAGQRPEDQSGTHRRSATDARAAACRGGTEQLPESIRLCFSVCATAQGAAADAARAAAQGRAPGTAISAPVVAEAAKELALAVCAGMPGGFAAEARRAAADPRALFALFDRGWLGIGVQDWLALDSLQALTDWARAVDAPLAREARRRLQFVAVRRRGRIARDSGCRAECPRVAAARHAFRGVAAVPECARRNRSGGASERRGADGRAQGKAAAATLECETHGAAVVRERQPDARNRPRIRARPGLRPRTRSGRNRPRHPASRARAREWQGRQLRRGCADGMEFSPPGDAAPLVERPSVRITRRAAGACATRGTGARPCVECRCVFEGIDNPPMPD